MPPAIRGLMGADKEGTLAALRTLRRELADLKIQEHRGRIVIPPAMDSWSSSSASSTRCAARSRYSEGWP